MNGTAVDPWNTANGPIGTARALAAGHCCKYVPCSPSSATRVWGPRHLCEGHVCTALLTALRKHSSTSRVTTFLISSSSVHHPSNRVWIAAHVASGSGHIIFTNSCTVTWRNTWNSTRSATAPPRSSPEPTWTTRLRLRVHLTGGSARRGLSWAADASRVCLLLPRQRSNRNGASPRCRSLLQVRTLFSLVEPTQQQFHAAFHVRSDGCLICHHTPAFKPRADVDSTPPSARVHDGCSPSSATLADCTGPGLCCSGAPSGVCPPPSSLELASSGPGPSRAAHVHTPTWMQMYTDGQAVSCACAGKTDVLGKVMTNNRKHTQ